MPKVKNEYLENKRNEILDAAFAVCKRKPAYDITMTDIVSETGMSQGASINISIILISCSLRSLISQTCREITWNK